MILKFAFEEETVVTDRILLGDHGRKGETGVNVLRDLWKK